MAISFYDVSVANYLQIVGGMRGVLDKGLKHLQEKGLDPDAVVDEKLAPDMLPFSFQIHAVAHHSLGALEAFKNGLFKPPGPKEKHSYAQLQGVIADTYAALEKMDRNAVDALEKNDVTFEIRGMKMPFTATGFLLSFSLPNFFFHSTTAYDILRLKGAPLGKRDFMGPMRMKGA
jgi:hypothetical protein